MLWHAGRFWRLLAGKILDAEFWPLDAGKGRKARNAGNARKGEGKYRARVVGGKVGEDLSNRGLCLPSGTAITDSDLNGIISVIRE